MGMMVMGDRRRRVLVGVRVSMSVIVTVFMIVVDGHDRRDRRRECAAPFSSTMNLVADTPARSTRVAETEAPSMRKAAQRAAQLFERQPGVEEARPAPCRPTRR